MGIKMKMSGGDKMEQFLQELSEKISTGAVLSVGFPEGATEEDGTPTAMAAAMNEFGHTVEVKHPHTEMANGQMVEVMGTYFQAPRPFFRNMINKGSKHWGPDLGKLLVACHYDAHMALDQLGHEMVGELVESINELWTPPLAPSTIAAKGFDKPLINKGDMWKSATHFVEDET